MKYKVGDRVKVREWEDMEKEFGVAFNGSIKIPKRSFPKEMRLYCGEVVEISKIYKDTYFVKGNTFEWRDEMFEDLPITRWEKVAELFGLELNEEFDIKGMCCNPYKFTESGLRDFAGYLAPRCFTGIMNGEYEIEKRPWKPKGHDEYYYVYGNGNIANTCFIENNPFDNAMLKCGWLFKTEEEAEANKERVLREMNEVL